MFGKRYQRRNTGDLAFDPALYQLVIATGTLLDRLLCGQPARPEEAVEEEHLQTRSWISAASKPTGGEP